jgi:hypothetical protein
MPESKQGIGGVLGDRAEAVQAFRTLRDSLEGPDGLKALLGNVNKAQQQDLAGEAAGLPSTDRQLNAAIQRAQAEGDLAIVTGEGLSEYTNLREAARADIFARRRRESPGLGTEASIFLERKFGTAADFLTPGDTLTQTQSNPDYRVTDPKLNEDIKEYLRQTAEGVNQIKSQQQSRVSTRPE